MSRTALAEVLRAQARVLLATADELELGGRATESAPAVFDVEHLPPGAASWRAVLEAGRRGELEVTRIGRRSIVTGEAWAAYVSSKKPRKSRLQIASSDVATLERMGVLIDMPRRAAR